MEQHHESPRSEEGIAKPPTPSEHGHWPREQCEESAQAGRPAPPGSTGSEPVLSLSKGRPDPEAAAEAGPTRIGWIDGHMPEIVDPLVPAHPDTSFSETRRLRHDGWTPDKKRLFHERFAECGIVTEACLAAGMSARAAYNLRDRDPLFAAGWEAARLMARHRLVDEAYSRSVNGIVERIYKDGMIVAERHRYDNRLTMAVIARLDARADRAEQRGDPHLALVGRWEDYLDALGEDRREDGLALLAPQIDVHENAPRRELHELHLGEEEEMTESMDVDPHGVWEEEPGVWMTDYPPPAGFEGEEHGDYGDDDYRRALSDAEQAVIDADRAADLAWAESLRDAYFSLASPGDSDAVTE